MAAVIGQSCRSVYAESCERHRCKKNAQLMRTLPDQKNRFDLLTEVDLSLNLVGRQGIKPVLDVVRVSDRVSKLSFADNFLTNESVKDILAVVGTHPAVEKLDLSRNPISHAAGKMLSEFARRNKQLRELVLEETLINPALVRIIYGKVRDNLRGPLQRPVPVSPSTPPARIVAQEVPRVADRPQTSSSSRAQAEQPPPLRAGDLAANPPVAPQPVPSEPLPQPTPRETASRVESVPADRILEVMVSASACCQAPRTSLPAWWCITTLAALRSGAPTPVLPARPKPLEEGQGLALLASLTTSVAAPVTDRPPWWCLRSLAEVVQGGKALPLPERPQAPYVPDGGGLGVLLHAVGQTTDSDADEAYYLRHTARLFIPKEREEGECINMVFLVAEEDSAASEEYDGLAVLAKLAREDMPCMVTSALGGQPAGEEAASPSPVPEPVGRRQSLHVSATGTPQPGDAVRLLSLTADPADAKPLQMLADILPATGADEEEEELDANPLDVLFIAAAQQQILEEEVADAPGGLGCLRLAHQRWRGRDAP
eukprot:TRINITY_DN3765_c3_g1_i1.p1 TRINITY_DN3765_c3_g1~~TRINITY_DN3765_c3_g1_i1.p1  ORF type:complete len:564 (+),score=162.68 TRINITY_DN3765_c3_g1_i1:69-1694(+)